MTYPTDKDKQNPDRQNQPGRPDKQAPDRQNEQPGQREDKSKGRF